jgi:hypothetical protein
MSTKKLLDGKPKVQLSLDLQTMADALPTAEIAVRAGVDWLEVGTPLILGEGLHAVAASTRSIRTIPSSPTSRRWTRAISKPR